MFLDKGIMDLFSEEMDITKEDKEVKEEIKATEDPQLASDMNDKTDAENPDQPVSNLTDDSEKSIEDNDIDNLNLDTKEDSPTAANDKKLKEGEYRDDKKDDEITVKAEAKHEEALHEDNSFFNFNEDFSAEIDKLFSESDDSPVEEKEEEKKEDKTEEKKEEECEKCEKEGEKCEECKEEEKKEEKKEEEPKEDKKEEEPKEEKKEEKAEEKKEETKMEDEATEEKGEVAEEEIDDAPTGNEEDPALDEDAMIEMNESVANNKLIYEGYLMDKAREEGLVYNEEFMYNMVANGLISEAMADRLLQERNIIKIKLDRKTRLNVMENRSIFVLARENNDPNYKKLVKIYKLRKILLKKLYSRWGSKAKMRAKKLVSQGAMVFKSQVQNSNVKKAVDIGKAPQNQRQPISNNVNKTGEKRKPTIKR